MCVHSTAVVRAEGQGEEAEIGASGVAFTTLSKLRQRQAVQM